MVPLRGGSYTVRGYAYAGAPLADQRAGPAPPRLCTRQLSCAHSPHCPFLQPCPAPPPSPPGNGSKIIRCELSLDDGKSWRLAEVTHRTPPNAYGRHWAWVWWSIEVPIGGCGRLPASSHAAAPRGGLPQAPSLPVGPFLTSPAPAELLATPEIICRAWDSCMNTQPNTFTW